MFPKENTIMLKSIMNLSLILFYLILKIIFLCYILNRIKLKNIYYIIYNKFISGLYFLFVSSYFRIYFSILISNGFIWSLMPQVYIDIEASNFIITGTFLESVYQNLGPEGAVVASTMISNYLLIQNEIANNAPHIISGHFNYLHAEGDFYFLLKSISPTTGNSVGSFKLVLNNLNWVGMINNNIQDTFQAHFGILNHLNWNQPDSLLQYNNDPYYNNHIFHRMHISNVQRESILNQLDLVNPNWRNEFN